MSNYVNDGPSCEPVDVYYYMKDAVYICLDMEKDDCNLFGSITVEKGQRFFNFGEFIYIRKMYSRCGDTEKAIITFQEALSVQVVSKATDQIFTASIHSVKLGVSTLQGIYQIMLIESR